jgi:hypothetical protein
VTRPDLSAILADHPVLAPVLARFDAIALPDAWLVAGAVAQSVWNALTSRAPEYGLKDIDIVYFDDADLSRQAEAAHELRLRRLFAGLPVKLDVKNEARVHLWYRDVFGKAIEPYRSAADAISSFPTTATSIGVRPRSGELELCAPFGCDDLLGGLVRANKRQITREVYERKIARWRPLWPELTYLPWDGNHTQPPSTT